MRVAIVHYHLRRGGVTSVIQNAVTVLTDAGIDVVVISGHAPAGDAGIGCPVEIVAGLDYADGCTVEPSRLAAEMKAAAQRALGAAPDVWHFHNHSLGKNPSLSSAVNIMAGTGAGILLQIHDLAEDGRPEMFGNLLCDSGAGCPEALGELLYPDRANVHFAFINSRDARAFTASGLDPERTHRLPNAVALDEAGDGMPPGLEGDGDLYLYPTRAIRRKNLGEFLFWAATCGEGRRFAVTLAPDNPAEKIRYERWVSFAEGRGLPVRFEAGMLPGATFAGLLKASHATVTTSVAEGFGLAFLEPWLAGRPVLGRKIPGITDDFEDAGVDLGDLYDKLLVPFEWLKSGEFEGRFREGYSRLLRAYGFSAQPGDIDSILSQAERSGMIDFGKLDEDSQMEVIAMAVKAGACGGWKPAVLDDFSDRSQKLRKNREIIAKEFSLLKYGSRLVGCYEKVAASPAGPACSSVNMAELLKIYLAPDNFCLLRS